jgi:chemotaxis receptor (MCP) glutamine deamidase CheD
MGNLKKLAGIINEDTNTNLMNKINKVTDPQTKKMLSDIAVIITDIKGNVTGIEQFYDWEHNNQNRSIVKEIKIANKTIDLLVKKLEAYIARVHK